MSKSAQQRFIVLETKSTSTSKSYWAIWGRGEGTSYSQLIARVYSEEWASKIVEMLNELCSD